jgi:hypothetical protein
VKQLLKLLALLQEAITYYQSATLPMLASHKLVNRTSQVGSILKWVKKILILNHLCQIRIYAKPKSPEKSLSG